MLDFETYILAAETTIMTSETYILTAETKILPSKIQILVSQLPTTRSRIQTRSWTNKPTHKWTDSSVFYNQQDLVPFWATAQHPFNFNLKHLK